MRRADRAMVFYELAGYLRGNLPYRFVPLAPLAVFLSAWTWGVASPFAAAVWIAFIGLEPRINNAFFGSRRELEALSLFPAEWRRIVLIKNVSSLIIGTGALALVSVVSLYFSPGAPAPGQLADFLLYLPTVCFPVLALGNASSARYPRRNAGAFSAGLAEAFWMSLTLLAASVPYFIITELAETPWLCTIYGAATAAIWYFRSVPSTAVRITNRSSNLWQTTQTSSNS